jgi:hypothetical protein
VNLSLHFTLEELTLSDTAERLGIPNDPPPWVVENLRRLAKVLEQVRQHLGGAIIVRSGYRCPELNAAVNGSKNSAHTKGLAADFVAPSYGTPRECAIAISRNGVEFDQLIAEGRWVHLGLSETEPRGEILTAKFTTAGVTYERGIT